MPSMPVPDPAVARHRRVPPWLNRVLGIALVLACAFYLYRSLDQGATALAASSRTLTLAQAAWLVAGSLGTLVLSTAYHVLAVARIQKHEVPATQVALSYALGQVVRYIPGKILGLLFQVRYHAGRISASTITLSLLVQTAYDYAWTIAFAGTLLYCGALGSLVPLAALPVVVGLLWWTHARSLCERALTAPRFLRRLFDASGHSGTFDARHSGAATAVLASEWLPMLLGIGMALQGEFGWTGAVLIGAAYLLAAMASLLAFVVPSGLVVREALFVWLGTQLGFPPAMLLFVGVLLRLALTLAEALNVVVFAAAAWRKRA